MTALESMKEALKMMGEDVDKNIAEFKYCVVHDEGSAREMAEAIGVDYEEAKAEVLK